MSTHFTPKKRREIVARFKTLTDDMGKTEAYRKLAEEMGHCVSTVSSQIKKGLTETEPLRYSVRAEVLTSGDFEVAMPEVSDHPKAVTIEAKDKRLLEFVVSDIHFPSEDQAAYELVLEVASDLQPDVFVLLGDIMDCYSVSSHDKDPNRATPRAFQDELLYTRAKLQELRERLPNTRIIYKEGNHETRLSRYILKNAAVLSQMKVLTLPEFLDLQRSWH